MKLWVGRCARVFDDTAKFGTDSCRFRFIGVSARESAVLNFDLVLPGNVAGWQRFFGIRKIRWLRHEDVSLIV